MKKSVCKIILSTAILAALLLAAIPVLAAPTGTGVPLYENSVRLAEGFSFVNTISNNASGKRVETYSLEARPGGEVYPIIVSGDKLYDTMTIEDITAWAEGKGMNVFGAVNADFFYSSAALPLGGLISDGEYISSTNGQNFLAFMDDGSVLFSKGVTVKIRLDDHGGGLIADPVTGQYTVNTPSVTNVEHVNKMRMAKGPMYLYTSAYHAQSTQTNLDGWAVVFRILGGGKLTVNGTLELVVEQVIPTGKDYPLEEDHIILSATADSPYAQYYSRFAVGDSVTLTAECSDPMLAQARWGCGCGDLLVENGSVTDPEGWDKAITKVNPRTALGVKPDGTLIAYVVDGRSASHSNGATLEELAADLAAKGCEFAVNLDGGGSSVMSVRLPGEEACALVNSPSSGSPRKCGCYILFVSNTTRSGVASSLSLKNDGAMVYLGASLPLEFTAADRAGYPAVTTDPVSAYGVLGSVADGVYKAGYAPGWDNLSLYSAIASGTGRVLVTDKLDSFTVVDADTGKAPVLTNLKPGSTLRLHVASASFLGRQVAVDDTAVTWEVSPELGEITQDGVFTLTSVLGTSGEITVSAGGTSVKLKAGAMQGLTDISGHWAESYIQELFYRGVVTGTGNLTFKPNDSIARCDFVLMLWRALGSPVMEPAAGEERALCSFTDVAQTSYYYDAVVWAERTQVVNGVGSGRFDPSGSLTRESAFTIVYRLLTAMRSDLPDPDPAALEGFSDANQIGSFAREAMESLTARGLISGSGGNCMPKKSTTRAEMAKIIYTALYGD